MVFIIEVCPLFFCCFNYPIFTYPYLVPVSFEHRNLTLCGLNNNLTTQRRVLDNPNIASEKPREIIS